MRPDSGFNELAGERSFEQLAAALGGRISGYERIGRSFVAACPWCDGRLLVWTRRTGHDKPGFSCADCGRQDVLGWLRLRLRETNVPAA